GAVSSRALTRRSGGGGTGYANAARTGDWVCSRPSTTRRRPHLALRSGPGSVTPITDHRTSFSPLIVTTPRVAAPTPAHCHDAWSARTQRGHGASSGDAATHATVSIGVSGETEPVTVRRQPRGVSRWSSIPGHV